MARLTAQARRNLPLSDFAVPSKAPGPGSYPIPDASHAAAAKGFAKRFGSSSTQAAVARKAAPFDADRTTEPAPDRDELVHRALHHMLTRPAPPRR